MLVQRLACAGCRSSIAAPLPPHTPAPVPTPPHEQGSGPHALIVTPDERMVVVTTYFVSLDWREGNFNFPGSRQARAAGAGARCALQCQACEFA